MFVVVRGICASALFLIFFHPLERERERDDAFLCGENHGKVGLHCCCNIVYISPPFPSSPSPPREKKNPSSAAIPRRFTSNTQLTILQPTSDKLKKKKNESRRENGDMKHSLKEFWLGWLGLLCIVHCKRGCTYLVLMYCVVCLCGV